MVADDVERFVERQQPGQKKPLSTGAWHLATSGNNSIGKRRPSAAGMCESSAGYPDISSCSDCPTHDKTSTIDPVRLVQNVDHESAVANTLPMRGSRKKYGN